MSDYRYFQDGDTVYRARGDRADRWLTEFPQDTEVQVVPLDAIVIRRDELPEVTEHPDSRNGVFYRASVRRPEPYGFPSYSTVSTNGTDDPLEHVEARMVEFAALAAYLRKHPPVDEEQVKALADHMAEIVVDEKFRDQPGAYHVNLARRLVERGVNAPIKEDS